MRPRATECLRCRLRRPIRVMLLLLAGREAPMVDPSSRATRPARRSDALIARPAWCCDAAEPSRARSIAERVVGPELVATVRPFAASDPGRSSGRPPAPVLHRHRGLRSRRWPRPHPRPPYATARSLPCRAIDARCSPAVWVGCSSARAPGSVVGDPPRSARDASARHPACGWRLRSDRPGCGRGSPRPARERCRVDATERMWQDAAPTSRRAMDPPCGRGSPPARTRRAPRGSRGPSRRSLALRGSRSRGRRRRAASQGSTASSASRRPSSCGWREVATHRRSSPRLSSTGPHSRSTSRTRRRGSRPGGRRSPPPRPSASAWSSTSGPPTTSMRCTSWASGRRPGRPVRGPP